MSNHVTRRRCISSGTTPTQAPDDQTESEVLNLVEVAAYLRCHPKTLRLQAVPRKIPHKRLGASWKFYRPKLVAWMQEDA